MFIMGCSNPIIVATGHQPLIGILGDKDLSNIMNPRIFRVKEKTLRYNFKIQHCPGKWQRGADAISRSPSSHAFIHAFHLEARSEDTDVGDSEALVELATIASLSDFKGVNTITPNMIRLEAQSDTSFKILMETILDGFPASRQLTVCMYVSCMYRFIVHFH